MAVRHTLATLPNWDGVWNAGRSWLDSSDIQASTVATALTPRNTASTYVQQVKAEAEGRHWWAAAFCLPDGFIRGISRGPQQFITRPDQVLMLTDTLVSTQVRWVHTDGKGTGRTTSSSRSGWASQSVLGWHSARHPHQPNQAMERHALAVRVERSAHGSGTLRTGGK